MADLMAMLGGGPPEGSESSAGAAPAARQTGVRTLSDPAAGGGGKGGMADMMAMLAGKGKGTGKGYEAAARPADPWASSGAGQRLDGGSGSSSAAPAAPVDTAELAAQVKPVDLNAPSFTIRVKFPDGKAVTCTFNGSHTVAQVRAYLQVTYPDAFKDPYVLMDAGGFPPKKLSEMGQSLDDAGIKAGAALNCRKA